MDNISKKPRRIQASHKTPAASECEWQVPFSLSKGAGKFFTILLSEEVKQIFFSTTVRKNESPACLGGHFTFEGCGLRCPSFGVVG